MLKKNRVKRIEVWCVGAVSVWCVVCCSAPYRAKAQPRGSPRGVIRVRGRLEHVTRLARLASIQQCVGIASLAQ